MHTGGLQAGYRRFRGGYVGAKGCRRCVCGNKLRTPLRFCGMAGDAPSGLRNGLVAGFPGRCPGLTSFTPSGHRFPRQRQSLATAQGNALRRRRIKTILNALPGAGESYPFGASLSAPTAQPDNSPRQRLGTAAHQNSSSPERTERAHAGVVSLCMDTANPVTCQRSMAARPPQESTLSMALGGCVSRPPAAGEGWEAGPAYGARMRALTVFGWSCQPSICWMVWMKMRLPTGGGPYFAAKRSVMLLRPPSGSGSTPRRV